MSIIFKIFNEFYFSKAFFIPVTFVYLNIVNPMRNIIVRPLYLYQIVGYQMCGVLYSLCKVVLGSLDTKLS